MMMKGKNFKGNMQVQPKGLKLKPDWLLNKELLKLKRKVYKGSNKHS
jgi:hypothetical protein